MHEPLGVEHDPLYLSVPDGSGDLVEVAQRRAAFLAAIVESSSTAIIGETLEGTITSWNIGAERMYGYTAEEVIGAPIDLLVFPNGPNEITTILEQVKRGEHVPPFETVRRRKDGRPVDVLLAVSPVRDTRVGIVGAATIAHDISEQKRAQRELVNSRRRALQILESIGDGFFALDQAWRFTYVNARAEQLWNRRREDLLGNVIWEAIPEVVGTMTQAEIERAAREHQHVEYQAPSALAGSWVEVNVYPGESGLSVYFRDITARKTAQTAERQLREHTERLVRRTSAVAEAARALAEASLDLPFALKALASSAVDHVGDGCIVYLLSEDRRRLEPAEIQHPDPEALTLARQVLAHSIEGEEMGRMLDGGAPFLEADVRPGAGPGLSRAELWPLAHRLGRHQRLAVPLRLRGQSIGLLLVWRRAGVRPYTNDDIDLLRQLAERGTLAIQTGRLFHQAQEAIRVREEVLAAVSHDLRAPLTAIYGTAQLVQRSLDKGTELSPDWLLSNMRRIQESTQRMQNWIGELIDVARLQAGQDLSLHLGLTSLSTLVEEAVADVNQGLPRTRIQLELPGQEVMGVWDGTRLRRVLDNLLSNALKYSPAGTDVRVSLGTVVQAHETWAAVRVTDWGLGIPADDVPHLFEQFWRGNNVGRIAGAGVGLAGASRIIQQHGGRLEVESTEGSGSSFTMWLPTEQPTASRPSASIEA